MAKPKIKMRVNNNDESFCLCCGTRYKYTKEMYDLSICGTEFTLCFDCVEILFKKLLRANTMYNGKVKTPLDIQRIKRYDLLKNPNQEVHVEIRPNCFGDFLKKKKCRECKFLKDCKEAFNDKWEE